MMGILILGAGGHGQVVAEILLLRACGSDVEMPCGYLDDNPLLCGQFLLGVPVLGAFSQLAVYEHSGIALGIGDNHLRHALFKSLAQQGEQFITACHPTAIVSPNSSLGQGCTVCAGVVVSPGATIMDNVILNTGCTVDHHNVIDAHAHIAPGAHLGGDVRVGKGALIGIGATVMPQCSIGEGSVIGAGSVVTKDIPAYSVAVGAPARIVRQR